MAVVALVLVALLVVVLLVARGGRDVSRRPDPERYLAVHGLPRSAAGHLLADRVLWRTRWFRILGAWCGFFIATSIRLWQGTTPVVMVGIFELSAALVGSLAGVGYAEARRPRSRLGAAVQSARLRPRDVGDYVDVGQERARLLLAALVLSILAVVVVLANDHAPRLAAAALGLAVTGLVLVARRLQRRIVERQQPVAPDGLLAVDDALRATAVRVVHHAVSGLMWCAVSFAAVLALDSVGSEPTAVALPLGITAGTALIAAISEWRRARRAPFDDRVRPPTRAVAATEAAS